MTNSSMPIDTSSGPRHVSVSGASGGRNRKPKNDSSTSQKKIKQPQRGPSIQELENMIRLQEPQSKKMTEIAPSPPPPPSPFNTFAPHQLNGAFQFRQPPVNYFNGFVGDHHAVHHHVYQNYMSSNELSSIQNSFVKCVPDACGGACYKKKRINGGGSSTYGVNPYRSYGANNNAFETIDVGRPRRVQVREVREVKEVMPVRRNEMSLTTEYAFFPRKNAAEMMRTTPSELFGSGLGLGVGGGGGASSDGRMLGLRAGDGSCVTAVTGNEEGCVSSIDLTLKLSY